MVLSKRVSALAASPASSSLLPSSVSRNDAARCGEMPGVILASNELSSGNGAGVDSGARSLIEQEDVAGMMKLVHRRLVSTALALGVATIGLPALTVAQEANPVGTIEPPAIETTPSQGTCGGSSACRLGTVPPGASATLSVTITFKTPALYGFGGFALGSFDAYDPGFFDEAGYPNRVEQTLEVEALRA